MTLRVIEEIDQGEDINDDDSKPKPEDCSPIYEDEADVDGKMLVVWRALGAQPQPLEE